MMLRSVGRVGGAMMSVCRLGPGADKVTPMGLLTGDSPQCLGQGYYSSLLTVHPSRAPHPCVFWVTVFVASVVCESC